MTTIRELTTRWGFNIDDQPLDRLDARVDAVKRNLAGLDRSIRILRGLTLAATGASVGFGFLLRETSEFEQMEVAFTTILGSADLAQKKLMELSQFAANTPFTIPGIVKNAKQLLAMNIESDALLPTLKALGDVSAGLSVPLERLALNYGQVRIQGKLTGRELRDFAVAGVPLASELAKNLGVAESAIADMVSRGAISFEMVEQAFKSMTGEGGKFANLMSKQSQTLAGQWSNLQDTIIMTAQAIGKEILPQAKAIVADTRRWIEANKEMIKQNLVGLFRALVTFIQKLGFWMGRLIGLAMKLAKIFGGLENVVKFLTIALLGLISVQLLQFLGNSAIAAFQMTKALLGLTRSLSLVAAAGSLAALWPVLLGAALVALILIVEDVITFFEGGKSVTGAILANIERDWPRLHAFLMNIKEFFVDAFNFAINFDTIFDGLSQSAEKAIEDMKSAIDNKVRDLFGIETSDFSLMDFITGTERDDSSFINDSAQDLLNKSSFLAGNVFAADDALNSDPEVAPVPGQRAGGGVTTITNQINVDASGMDPETAKKVVEDAINASNDRAMREAERQLRPAVAG